MNVDDKVALELKPLAVNVARTMRKFSIHGGLSLAVLLSVGGMVAGTAQAASIDVDFDNNQMPPCVSSGGGVIGRTYVNPTTTQANGTDQTSVVAAGCNAVATGIGASVYGSYAVATGVGSTATGFLAEATGAWSTALGLETVSTGAASTAVGFGSVAAANNAVAIGGAAGEKGKALTAENSTAAFGAGSVAIGSNYTRGAQAVGESSIAMAGEATALGQRSIALGEKAVTSATANDTVVIGSASQSSGMQSVVVGPGSVASGNQSVTMGSGNASAGDRGITLGVGNDAKTAWSQVIGNDNTVSSTLVTPESEANGDALVIGNGNSVSGVSSNLVVVGENNKVTDSIDGVVIGKSGEVSADRAIAIGREASVSVADGVALGSGAVSDRVVSPDSGSIVAGGGEISFDTTDYRLKGAVSLGNDDEYRQITHLADGTEDHDAVSLRQLRGAMGSLSKTDSLFFHANSTSDKDSLAIGEESIAVGPMTTVNADHATGIGYNTVVENTGAGGVAIGDESQVSGVQSVAIGASASATTANSVALGADSATGEVVAVEGIDLVGNHFSFSGSEPVGTVSIGGAGAERTLTNVAAGRISASSTDAVNGSQLHATNQALEEQRGWTSNLFDEVDLRIDEVDQRIDELAQNGGGTNGAAVQYDAGSDKGLVTLDGEGGTTIANLADGEVASNSTDAVNGGQLWDIEQRIDNMEAGGSSSLSDTSTGPAALASGEESLAIGKGSKANADGGVAIGSGSVADREGMNGAKEAFSNVEVASKQGAVSVGTKGGERQITHVAGGTEDTDAVNVRQLRAVQEGSVNYDRKSDGSVDYSSVTMGKDGSGPVQIHNVAAGSAPTDAVNMSQLSALDRKYSNAYGELSDRIDDVERTASAGIAAIAAMGDAPYVAGKFTYHVGSGYYNGETALGLDLRRTSDSGRWSIDAGIGGSSVDVAASLGISGVIN